MLYKLSGRALTLCLIIILSETDSPESGLVELGPGFAIDLEAKDLWLVVVDLWGLNYCSGKLLQEGMWKRGTENTSIQVQATRTALMVRQAIRDVRLFTARAINFDTAGSRLITHAQWEQSLAITMQSWTSTIDTLQKLVVDLS